MVVPPTHPASPPWCGWAGFQIPRKKGSAHLSQNGGPSGHLQRVKTSDHLRLTLSPRLFEAPLRCYWGLIRKTVPPFCRIRVSAKMGGLPSSTGQLPSAADGSRIDATPNGRIASAANTNGRAGRWGGPPSPYAVWSRCRISGPSAPVRAAACCGPRGVPERASQGPQHLRPSPCRLALRHGGMHLLYPPSLNFREDDRLLVGLSVHALVSVREEGDGGLGVLCCIGLHGHPRVREGEMPETSGAS